MKSAGVMMTGQVNPAFVTIAEVFGNVTGFAMCLQFQVSKTSMPWTAAVAM